MYADTFDNKLITEILIHPNSIKNENQKEVNELINTYVKEHHHFFGLAFYYNDLNYFKVNAQGKEKVDLSNGVKLSNGEWLAIAGRFNVLALKATDAIIILENFKIKIKIPEKNIASARQIISTKYRIGMVAPELEQLRYAQLMYPLAVISKWIEKIIIGIHDTTNLSWGLVLILFTFLFKIVLLPVGLMTAKFQKQVSKIQAVLTPQLAEIKKNFDGEEAHNKMMAAYKTLEVSPFYTLKPMLGMLIQIPLLIGIFNALGEMPQFANESFLWIKDLSLPDTLGQFSFTIPFLGNQFNLMPFLMTLVTILATIFFKDSHASKATLKSKRRNLYIMAAVFFVLFYPFPAAMVLFWTLNSVFQLFLQQFT